MDGRTSAMLLALFYLPKFLCFQTSIDLRLILSREKGHVIPKIPQKFDKVMTELLCGHFHFIPLTFKTQSELFVPLPHIILFFDLDSFP